MHIKIRIINYKEWIPELLCLLILYSYFLRFVGHFVAIATYVSIISSFSLWFYILLKQKINRKLGIFIFCFVIYDFLFFVLGKGSLATLMSYLPVAIVLLDKKKLSSILWYVIPASIVVDILIAWQSSPNHYLLYNNISRNYISVLTLFALAIYIIKCEKNNKQCNIFFVYITWIICLSAIGRGGIIASSVVLLLFITQRIFDNQNTSKSIRNAKMFFALIVLVIIIILVEHNLEYIEVTYFGRFFGTESSASSSSELRSYIILEYLNESTATLKNLIFGADASMISSVADNLHNSYLQLHAKFGLLGLIFVIVESIKSIVFMFENKKWQYMFIFIGLLVRAGTDWCFPTFMYDAFILYFLMYPRLDSSIKEGDIQ